MRAIHAILGGMMEGGSNLGSKKYALSINITKMPMKKP